MTQTRDSQTRNMNKRENRIPPGAPLLKLEVSNKDDGFFYYWAIERQFSELLQGGYSFVEEKKAKIGQDKENSEDFSYVVREGGGGDKLTLMRIPQMWYDENREDAEKPLREFDDQINNAVESDNTYVRDLTTNKRLSRISRG